MIRQANKTWKMLFQLWPRRRQPPPRWAKAEAAKELVRLVLAREGSTLQDILVDETAKLGDATVRRALRAALIDAPTSVAAPLGLSPPAALTELLAPSEEDERALATASELAELLGPRVREQINEATSAPPQPSALSESLGSLLGTEDARKDVVDGIEGVGALSRRIGALMLRRAAERATATAALPDVAREAIVSGNTALADVIAPAEDTPAA